VGVLSDLVVGDLGDAETIASSRAPSKEFDGIDIKGIDSVKFTTLHELVTGRPYEELVSKYEPTLEVSDDGPWVFVIPDELVSRLASLPQHELREVGTRWAQTEEFRLDRWEPGLVVTALGEICELAAKAFSSQRSLFLWMSL
jgi:hypothetical protein